MHRHCVAWSDRPEEPAAHGITKRSIPGSGASLVMVRVPAGTVGDFATQLIATQASDAGSATALNQGQQVVLNSVTARMSAMSGVNVDTEMTQLIQLQTAYGANARVMSAAKEMLDTLMRVGL